MKLIFTILSIVLLSLDAARGASSSSIRGTDPLEASKKISSESSGDEEVYDLTTGKCPIFTEDPKNGNTKLGKKMIAATKPCGYYQSQGCNYDVIPANVVHPGEGVGDLEFEAYIVQFDIGVHREIRKKVMDDFNNWDGGNDKRDCIGCDKDESETCLELIVKGNSDATGGCAGKCGSGCVGAGWAKDCMKHDVCATYKALVQSDKDFSQADGFCYDPDCGDEAATTIHNCYINDWGPDSPITCEKENFINNKWAYGHWSYTTGFFSEGPCYNFRNWKSGQGLPDKDRIDNHYDFLAYLESQGVDISRVE